jgi:hypothetical protein
MTTEQRLRDAIRARTDSVDPAPDGWERIEGRLRARPARSYRPVLLAAAAVVVATLAVAAWLPRSDGSSGGKVRAGRADQPEVTSATTPSTAPPSTAAITATTTGAATGGIGSSQPLWPFSSKAEVTAWQESYRSGGHSPWHVDAAATAQSFTTGYLGFTEIDKVVSREVRATEAWITVGYTNPNGDLDEAAVIHLVRWGSGSDAPWEVVGSRDYALSLTIPKYGSSVRSPLEVGGLVTGVDESIHVQMRAQSAPDPIGDACCLAAGGEGASWRTSISFRPATSGIATVVAWTGGHLQAVERFAVTGVRIPT